jgi:hypothetical protein
MGKDVEENSPDWTAIKRRYEGEPCSVRALAREHKTTDTRIRRRADLERWTLFSAKKVAKPTPQRGLQRRAEKIENEEIWAFEPRHDALVSGLCRVRNAVDTAEDAIYSDLRVVMALLWLETPFADLATALQMDEVKLEELWGPAILAFVQNHLRPATAARRRRGKELA